MDLGRWPRRLCGFGRMLWFGISIYEEYDVVHPFMLRKIFLFFSGKFKNMHSLVNVKKIP
jgi:hypothetical protein